MPPDKTRRRLLSGLVAYAATTTAAAACNTCQIMDPNWQPATPQRTEPRAQTNAAPQPAQPAAPRVQNRGVIRANELRLAVHQVNGGWNFRDTIWAQGQFDSRAMRDLNHFMRDWRDNHTLVFSPTTAIVLARAQLQSGRLLNVYSGTRSRATNDWLRSRSSEVAANSLHLRGRAADCCFDGFSTSQTARLFRANGGGGVNAYDVFAHVDDGGVRTW